MHPADIAGQGELDPDLAGLPGRWTALSGSADMQLQLGSSARIRTGLSPAFRNTNTALIES